MQIGGEPLEAFESVNFDWVTRLNSVWSDQTADVPAVHQRQRAELVKKLRDLAARPFEEYESDLGLVCVGTAGSGKTHFLSFVRRHAFSLGLNFVLVDMTDVRDFWSTIALGYLDSLDRPAAVDERTQLQTVLQKLIELALPDLNARQYVDHVARFELGPLKRFVTEVLSGLSRALPGSAVELRKHDSVIRALFVRNSIDFEMSSTGHTWLQGVALDDEDAARFGIRPSKVPRISILRGLSWVMGIRAATVLAFDQLDAIVAQYNLAAGDSGGTERREEQQEALAIIEGIAGGLSAVVDQTFRTLPIVTALNSTWTHLRQRGLESHRDRFQEPPFILGSLQSPDVARAIAEARLSLAYEPLRFEPPYPTWPFKPGFFTGLGDAFPRAVLQRCADHQRHCAAQGNVIEIGDSGEMANTSRIEPPTGDRYDSYLEQASPDPSLLEEAQEDALGELILQGCSLLLKEADPPPDIDHVLDADFSGNRRFPSLHARVRTIFHREGDREDHACLRVLQRTNPRAYQARLTAAMTAAGIDRSLPFRKLLIVRTTPPQTGPKMTALTAEFQRRGGLLLSMTAEEAGRLRALVTLTRQGEPAFYEWLRRSRPVSRLAFFGSILPEYPDTHPAPAPVDETAGTQPKKEEEMRPSLPELPGAGALKSSPPVSDSLALGREGPVIGRRLIAGEGGRTVSLNLSALSRHTVIRAGSGGGKTVLLKRIVEEAALARVPSILIDSANDLAQMGDRWPSQPEHWIAGDAERAQRYHKGTEVIVWTPRRAAGRPLHLAPIPDLAQASQDEDQLNLAVDLAGAALEQHIIAGAGESANKKRGVLHAALRYFGRHGAGDLEAFASLLSDLPPEAGGGITQSHKLATSMADGLRAAMQTDPSLQRANAAVDIAELFGLGRGRTRISVISMIGLGTPATQQNFVNQLCMALFSWIKKNPSLGPHGLTGLLVIDEAKDFLPAVSTAVSKKSLMVLAAQARKYGLGMVLATQNPKDLDYRAVAQFSTQFFGKANSPQVIEFIKGLIVEKGGAGEDIGRLQKGHFYMISEGIEPPIKIVAPMCLSYHPDGRPLTEEEVLARSHITEP